MKPEPKWKGVVAEGEEERYWRHNVEAVEHILKKYG